MSRIFYFLLTNLAIVLVLSITMSIFGIGGYLDANGINYQGLLVFTACFGFGGAFISLALSKWTAKKMSGAQVITNPNSEQERWLIDTVAYQAQQANIGMPEVAIFPSSQLNAFIKGDNLLDEEKRDHTSFLKDKTLMGERAITFGLSGTF